jgi:hypothetical protein
MIESVKQIQTVKAIDLPHTFDILVGMNEFRFEIDEVDTHYVYIKDSEGEIVYLPHNEMVAILIPDTWENAKWDIAFGLMKENLI